MPLKHTKDGRTVRTHASYTSFRREVFKFQMGLCANPDCSVAGGRSTYIDDPLESDYSFHINHLNGRGGGKRDDVMTRDGKQVCRGECGRCHRKFHNQGWGGSPQWSNKRRGMDFKFGEQANEA